MRQDGSVDRLVGPGAVVIADVLTLRITRDSGFTDQDIARISNVARGPADLSVRVMPEIGQDEEVRRACATLQFAVLRMPNDARKIEASDMLKALGIYVGAV